MIALLTLIIAITIISPIIWRSKYTAIAVLINMVLWAVIEIYSEFSSEVADADAIFAIAILFKSLIIGLVSYLAMIIIGYISNKIQRQ